MKNICMLFWMVFCLGTHDSRRGSAALAQAGCWSLKTKSSRLSKELWPEQEQLQPTLLSNSRAHLNEGHSPE